MKMSWRLFCFLLVVKVMGSNSAQSIQGDVQLNFLLIRYDNDAGTLQGGQRCRLLGGCNLSFKFCIEPTAGSNPDPGVCNGSKISTGLVERNENEIRFSANQLYGEWYNPYPVSYLTGFSNLTLKSVVYDVGFSNSERVVDKFKFIIDTTRLNVNHTALSFVNWPGLRSDQPSKMSLNISFVCPHGRNGSNCKFQGGTVAPQQPLPVISGSVRLTVQLLGYYVADGRLRNGIRCDLGTSDCDLSLELCMDTSHGGNPGDITACSGTWLSTGTVTENKNDVTFHSDHYYKDWYNPMHYTLSSGFQQRYFKVRTFDATGSTLSEIDTFILDLNSNLINLHNPAIPMQMLNIRGQRRNTPTLLLLANVSLSCPQGINGTNCNAPSATPTATATAPVQIVTVTSKPFLPTYWWIVLIICILGTLLLIGICLIIAFCVYTQKRHRKKKEVYSNSFKHYPTPAPTYHSGWTIPRSVSPDTRPSVKEQRNIYNIPRVMGDEKLYQSTRNSTYGYPQESTTFTRNKAVSQRTTDSSEMPEFSQPHRKHRSTVEKEMKF